MSDNKEDCIDCVDKKGYPKLDDVSSLERKGQARPRRDSFNNILYTKGMEYDERTLSTALYRQKFDYGELVKSVDTEIIELLPRRPPERMVPESRLIAAQEVIRELEKEIERLLKRGVPQTPKFDVDFSDQANAMSSQIASLSSQLASTMAQLASCQAALAVQPPPPPPPPTDVETTTTIPLVITEPEPPPPPDFEVITTTTTTTRAPVDTTTRAPGGGGPGPGDPGPIDRGYPGKDDQDEIDDELVGFFPRVE